MFVDVVVRIDDHLSRMWASGKPANIEADLCLRTVSELGNVCGGQVVTVNQKSDVEGRARGEIPRVRDRCRHGEVLEGCGVSWADHHTANSEVGLRHV